MSNNLSVIVETKNYNVVKSTKLAVEYHKHKEASVKLVLQALKTHEDTKTIISILT